MLRRAVFLLLGCALLCAQVPAADTPAKASAPAGHEATKDTHEPVATKLNGGQTESDLPEAAAPPLTATQIIQILDDTVQWYRTLGSQQQNASEPSDQLIVFANRQAADKVVALSFQTARANAELLSSAGSAESSTDSSPSQPQALQERQTELKAKLKSLDAEIAAEHGAPASAKLGELQAERAVIAARENLLDNMTDFENQSDPRTAGAEALKAEIDAIAASIPAQSSAASSEAAAQPATTTPAAAAPTAATLSKTPAAADERTGIWSLATEVMALRRKILTIESIDRQTAALSTTFEKIGAPSMAQLKTLAAQGDALSLLADSASAAELKDLRSRLDTLAWLIQQSTAIVLPISQVQVLLKEYRHNLDNWRDASRHRYQEAWGNLGVRVGILAGILLVLFILGEIWRRAVQRFAHDVQRRYQLLVVRRIVLWTIALCVVGLSFVSELSSFATFAGLITAGVAVAMQSVLVSVVGYFFLIGKYGIRVGDRIQIGAVTGEVIDLGLVRMHLLELNQTGVLGPTGRVVGFPNLVVFQSTGGLFKQIPGVNLTWREIGLTLPPTVSDYAGLKERLLDAVNSVAGHYRDEIDRQSKAIASRTEVTTEHDWEPQVQMHLVDGHMQALIRYPAHLPEAAEVDERVSEAVLRVIQEAEKPSAAGT
jgi:small-conductance mechanosensitive channel